MPGPFNQMISNIPTVAVKCYCDFLDELSETDTLVAISVLTTDLFNLNLNPTRQPRTNLSRADRIAPRRLVLPQQPVQNKMKKFTSLQLIIHLYNSICSLTQPVIRGEVRRSLIAGVPCLTK